MLIGYFDGVCEPKNPGGHAAWGACLWRDAVEVWRGKGYCGAGPRMSNNVAEYSGVCALLERLQVETEPCLIRGDSALVIYHFVPDPSIGRKWKVNGGLYMPFHLKAKALYEQMKGRLSFEWISRDQNAICDVLSKAVLHERGIEFRIQPERPERKRA
jgi:ribonuclease HI